MAAKTAKRAPTLAKAQSIALEVELLELYSTEEFQRTLHEKWNAADGDPIKQGKARQEACRPLQFRVIPKYGFEATRLGVCHSVTAYTPFNNDLDELVRSTLMRYLITPAEQRLVDFPGLNMSGGWVYKDSVTGEEKRFALWHEPGSTEFVGASLASGGGDDWTECSGRLCGNFVIIFFRHCKCFGLVQDYGCSIANGFTFLTPEVYSFFTGRREDWQADQEPQKEEPAPSEILDAGHLAYLAHIDEEAPLIYGGFMDSERAPSVFLRSAHTADVEALVEYLREDPEGPFFGLLDEWPDEKRVVRDRWDKWNFEKGGEQEPLLKADWHSVHNWGFETSAFVPRASNLCVLKRAPRRILAFMECFREVNYGCWTSVLRALEDLRSEAVSQSCTLRDLGWLIDFLSKVMRKRAHFGAVEAQVWWGPETITTRSHKDGATSLLHLSMTLGGVRCVRVGGFDQPFAPELRDPSTCRPVRENVWDDSTWYSGKLRSVDLEPGAVYCSAPFVFEHGVMYKQCTRHNPVIALQCRLAFSDLKDAERINGMRSRDMLMVSTAVAGAIRAACDRGEVRLPTLQEVMAAEKMIAFSEAKFTAGRNEDRLFQEFPPPA